MADHIYKKVELVGSSKVGVEDAIEGAIARAAETLRNLDWFEVKEIRGNIRDGKPEFYQVTLGGSGDEHTSIGDIVGRGFGPDEITDAIEKIVDTYLGLRLGKDEKFLDAYRRVGAQPFKEALYGAETRAA